VQQSLAKPQTRWARISPVRVKSLPQREKHQIWKQSDSGSGSTVLWCRHAGGGTDAPVAGPAPSQSDGTERLSRRS
jgi:hypothetical protein